MSAAKRKLDELEASHLASADDDGAAAAGGGTAAGGKRARAAVSDAQRRVLERAPHARIHTGAPRASIRPVRAYGTCR